LILLYSSQTIETWIDQLDVKSITLTGFLCCLIIASQDIAVDGLVLTILSENYVGLGSVTQGMG